MHKDQYPIVPSFQDLAMLPRQHGWRYVQYQSLSMHPGMRDNMMACFFAHD